MLKTAAGSQVGTSGWLPAPWTHSRLSVELFSFLTATTPKKRLRLRPAALCLCVSASCHTLQHPAASGQPCWVWRCQMEACSAPVQRVPVLGRIVLPVQPAGIVRAVGERARAGVHAQVLSVAVLIEVVLVEHPALAGARQLPAERRLRAALQLPQLLLPLCDLHLTDMSAALTQDGAELLSAVHLLLLCALVALTLAVLVPVRPASNARLSVRTQRLRARCGLRVPIPVPASAGRLARACWRGRLQLHCLLIFAAGRREVLCRCLSPAWALRLLLLLSLLGIRGSIEGAEVQSRRLLLGTLLHRLASDGEQARHCHCR